MSVSEWLAVAGILIAIGALVQRQEALRDNQQRQEHEIERLRVWRHKIGEDPARAAIDIARMLDERLKELERRRSS